MTRMTKARTFARAHTKKISLIEINNNINMIRGNIGLSGKYYDTR